MDESVKLLVILYLFAGYWFLIKATAFDGDFVKGYERGEWDAQAIIVLSMFTVFFWPYVLWLVWLRWNEDED